MSDRLWCPDCNEPHYRPIHTDDPDSCNECGSELAEQLPLAVRIRERVGQAVAFVILAAIIIGPPTWAASVLLSGTPLFATRTVTQTVTQYYGVIPTVLPVLFIWAMFLFIGWAMATGAIPRMRV